MQTSFLSIFNKSGIACASSEDHTLYQLSKEEPVVVAVDPNSPIPWESLIDGYKRLGEPKKHSELEGYAKDFEEYISAQIVDISIGKLSDDDVNIIFMGYGTDDIFPSVCDISVGMTEEHTLGYLYLDKKRISSDTISLIASIGDFETVLTLIYGTTNDIKNCMVEKLYEMLDTYSERVIEKFKGTKYESAIKARIDEYNANMDIWQHFHSAAKKAYNEASIGIDSFSIEDMVNTVETFVDANVNLNHLRSGGKEKLSATRELAVITRYEGLTWIKHGLYTF
jgi:hypothetical protein